jgi:hypothetical protein
VTTPIRIQRKRTKGWRLPPNTVCVTRPGRWGNPYTVAKGYSCWSLYLDGHFACDEPTKERVIQLAIALFRDCLLGGRLAITVSDVRRELRGKNLACFCPIGSPCHADVLLAIANEDGESK